MIFVVICYAVVATVLFTLLSTRIGRWARLIGTQGPEGRAKTVAMAWRFSEVGMAAVVLAILCWVSCKLRPALRRRPSEGS
jgi:hypothetical protein